MKIENFTIIEDNKIIGHINNDKKQVITNWLNFREHEHIFEDICASTISIWLNNGSSNPYFSYELVLTCGDI